MHGGKKGQELYLDNQQQKPVEKALKPQAYDYRLNHVCMYIYGEGRDTQYTSHSSSSACLPAWRKGAGLRKFQLIVCVYFMPVILLAVQITTTEKTKSKWQRKK